MVLRKMSRFIKNVAKWGSRPISLFFKCQGGRSPSFQDFKVDRCLSHKPKDNIESHPKKAKSWVLRKVSRFVESSERMLEKKAPKVYKGYRYFKDGVKELGQDTKDYYKISKEIEGGKSLSKFTYRELMLYRKMPDELFKAIPILILAVIPFGIYLFAIVYFFPRTFLTSHFLSAELQKEIYLDRHKKQLQFFTPLLKDMEARLNPEIHKTNPKEAEIIKNILHQVQRGHTPGVGEILQSRKLFESSPYGMEKLPIRHRVHLADCWGYKTSQIGVHREAVLLLHIDHAMIKLGTGVLSDKEVQEACFSRGFNPENSSRQEQVKFLEKWCSLSKQVDEDSLSLLLHAAVLLNYNLPANQKILKGKS